MEQNEYLMDQIDRLISTYQWTVGIFITIILFFAGFFVYIQFKIKKEQEQKIKNDISNDVKNDIKNTIEPIILFNIEQLKLDSSMNFENYNKTLQAFIELDKNYTFTKKTKSEILNLRYSIFEKYRGGISYFLTSEIHEEPDFKKLQELFGKEKFPNSDEVSKLILNLKNILSEENEQKRLHEIQSNYEFFYGNFIGLNLSV